MPFFHVNFKFNARKEGKNENLSEDEIQIDSSDSLHFTRKVDVLGKVRYVDLYQLACDWNVFKAWEKLTFIFLFIGIMTMVTSGILNEFIFKFPTKTPALACLMFLPILAIWGHFFIIRFVVLQILKDDLRERLFCQNNTQIMMENVTADILKEAGFSCRNFRKIDLTLFENPDFLTQLENIENTGRDEVVPQKNIRKSSSNIKVFIVISV